jgi:hypothetical protein
VNTIDERMWNRRIEETKEIQRLNLGDHCRKGEKFRHDVNKLVPRRKMNREERSQYERNVSILIWREDVIIADGT